MQKISHGKSLSDLNGKMGSSNPFYVKRYKSLVWRFTSIIIFTYPFYFFISLRYITLKNKKFFMLPLI